MLRTDEQTNLGTQPLHCSVCTNVYDNILGGPLNFYGSRQINKFLGLCYLEGQSLWLACYSEGQSRRRVCYLAGPSLRISNPFYFMFKVTLNNLWLHS